MKYCVNVPLERELQFPNRCPFSDQSSPTGTVRLKRSSTSTVIPLPGAFLNKYSTTSLRVPAAKTVALLAAAFEIMIWLSILGGVAVAMLLAGGEGHHSRFAILYIGVGLVAALAFRVARWFVRRRVRVGNAWNGFMVMSFASESYAKEFTELNRLAI